MKIFIGWSGDLSHNVALVLTEWLGSVIQTIKCFVSSEDIAKGTRWFPDISKELESSNFGIICITRENMDAPWIMFEAGALSKNVDRSKVCPLLIDITPTDLTGPLTEFQWTHPLQDKNEMLKLIKTINSQMGDSALDTDKVVNSFNQWWEKYLKDINTVFKENEKAGKVSIPQRDQREILDEILNLSRTIAQNMPDPAFNQLISEVISERDLIKETLAKAGYRYMKPLGAGLSSALRERRPPLAKLIKEQYNEPEHGTAIDNLIGNNKGEEEK